MDSFRNPVVDMSSGTEERMCHVWEGPRIVALILRWSMRIFVSAVAGITVWDMTVESQSKPDPAFFFSVHEFRCMRCREGSVENMGNVNPTKTDVCLFFIL